MRLDRYLLEDEMASTYADIMVKKIQQKCKPYLKLLGSRNPLMRGMNVENIIWSPGSTSEAGGLNVRQDRVSKAGHDPAHMLKMNEWLESHNVARRDRSVIAISKPKGHSFAWFGPAHWIWPVGKFKYAFVRSDDFNSSSRVWFFSKFMAWLKYHSDKEEMEWEGKNEKGYVTKIKYKPIDDFVSNTKFNEAYSKGYEIWFECDSYLFAALEGTNRGPTIGIAEKIGERLKYTNPI